jgi:zinc transport system substrate-binding protein
MISQTPRTLILSALVTASTLVTGCGKPSASTGTNATNSADTTGSPRVFAANYALASFAEAIGGDMITVQSPTTDGAAATSFRPTPEQIIAIQDCQLILLNGADFSSWVSKASLPGSRTVRTANAFRDQWLESNHTHDHDHDHQHGPDGDGVDHHHAHWAAYTWLDPRLAKEQAQIVGNSLARALPGKGRAIAERSAALDAEFAPLIEQAKRISAMTLPPVIAAEPNYEYLARACALDLHDADWHWNEPQPHDGMESLKQLIEATGATIILVPETPTPERAKVLSDLGLEHQVVPLLADRPEGDDGTFLSSLKNSLDTLEALGSR